MRQTGFFWHVHHGILLEWCFSRDERAAYIRIDKPSNEQELHLRLFQPMKGQLPHAVIEAGEARSEAWEVRVEASKAYNEASIARVEAEEAYYRASKAYREARKAHVGAWKASDEAQKVFVEVWRKASNEAGKASNEAREARVEAEEAYLEALKVYNETLSSHRDEIEALHAQECLNCPWDGETIFPAA